MAAARALLVLPLALLAAVAATASAPGADLGVLPLGHARGAYAGLGDEALVAAAGRILLQEGQGQGGASQGGTGGAGGQGGKGGGGGRGGGSAPKGPAMPFSAWATSTLAHDGWLIFSFAVSLLAAPGVALLLWPLVFDAAHSLSSTCKSMRA